MAQSINPAWASRQLTASSIAAAEQAGVRSISLATTVKIMLTLLLIGVCFSLYRQTGYELQRAAARKSAAQANVERLQNEAVLREGEINRVKTDDRLLESMMRESLGLVRPGDVVIRLEQPRQQR